MSIVATDLRLLPSTIDESLAKCPQFRTLVVGNSGVGKSSLISNIFNISLEGIDVARGRAGTANIESPYTSDRNKFFVLHDSQGFEAGKINNWEIVEKFLHDRSTAELKDQVHAIWLCIETPRTGARAKQTGDEKLLSLAKKLEIPMVIVFTKFDLLVNEHIKMAQKSGVAKKNLPAVSRANAEEDFKKRIESYFLREQVLCVRVSNKESHIETLDRLAEVTYRSLPEEEGPLLAWVVAQQVNAYQKVEESIRQGCKKYWRNLGQSVVFQDHKLIECLLRITQDILKVWNFHDPNSLLSTDKFFNKITDLVSEFSLRDNEQNGGSLRFLFKVLPAGTRSSNLVGFLYQMYNAIPATAQYLGAYIIDLTVVLHRIFTATLTMKSPRVVSEFVIGEQLRGYKRSTELAQNHDGVRGISITAAGFEQEIARLIRDSVDSLDDNAVRGRTRG